MVRYGYDAAGRQTDLFYPSGDRLTSVLSGAGRVTAMNRTPPGGSQTPFLMGVTHKPFGPVTGFQTAAGVTEARSFDTRYRRLSQSTVLGGNTLLSFTYGNGTDPSTGYDKAGNLLSLHDTAPGSGTTFDRTFSYHPDRYFLASSTGPFGASYAQQTISWTLDRNGNRLTETRSGIGTTTYTYGDDGSGHSNGLLIGVAQPGQLSTSVMSYGNGDLYIDDQGLQWDYDALGRPESILGASCGPRGMHYFGNFAHDARGHRVFREVACSGINVRSRSRYLYGADDELLAMYGFGGPFVAPIGWSYYVYLEGEPIAAIDFDGSGAQFGMGFLHGDHLGRPIGMTDGSTGALMWRPEYEPFGKSLLPRLASSSAPGFRFPGQWESPDSADLDPNKREAISTLTDNWNRTYVQRWGRYSQPDPEPLAWSIFPDSFGYANGAPLRFTDRTGLFAILGSCKSYDIDPTRREDVERGIAFACSLNKPGTHCNYMLRNVSAALGWSTGKLPDCIDENCNGSAPIGCDCHLGDCGSNSAGLGITLGGAGNSNCPMVRGRGYGPTIFHETLHRCGFGAEPTDSLPKGSWFRLLEQACAGWRDPKVPPVGPPQ